MARNNNILAGITLLDPDNDDHWTAGGLPAVAAVASLSSEDGVTRLEITALAPYLTRDTAPELPVDEVEAEVYPDPEDEEEEEAEEEQAEDELSDVEQAKAALRAEIDACLEVIQTKASERDQAIADIKALEETCSILETRYVAMFPRVDPVSAVQAYQQRSAKQRSKRAEDARRAPGAAKSRLDQAMMVRRGFGQSRPEGFLIDGG